jgi:CheY-like chemotaxis protein
MPKHDGIETFCRLRETPELAQIPICIVTGHPEMRSLIYDRPAPPPEGFLAKPVDPDTLVSTVRRILGLRRRKAGLR